MSLFTKRKSTDWIVIHCSATPPDMDIGVKEIRAMHRQRGFVDIGYHLVIRRDGTVEAGRPLDVIGAHVAGHNHNSVAISLVGGVERGSPKGVDNFTPAQWTALAEQVRALKLAYPKAGVQGHRDFPGVAKDCPCFNAKTWWSKQDKLGPVAAPAAPPKTETISAFLPTFWSIARKHKVPVDVLIKLNPQLNPTDLKVGDVVVLPQV